MAGAAASAKPGEGAVGDRSGATASATTGFASVGVGSAMARGVFPTGDAVLAVVAGEGVSGIAVAVADAGFAASGIEAADG